MTLSLIKFKRSIAIGISVSTILFYFMLSQALSQEAVPKDLLGTANERIEKHRKGDMELRLLLPDGTRVAEGAKVSIEQTRHQFLFGCNIFKFDTMSTPQQNEAYKRQYRDLLNFATLGFYYGSYERSEGQTMAEQRKATARWCKENGIRTKGHPLFWTIEPGWLAGKDADEADALTLGRITRDVSEFKGLIDTWDVLNEACVWKRQGTERKAVSALRLYEKYGQAGLINKVFDLSRKANPAATLILNDYNTSPEFVKVIEDSLAKGADINVIGIQSHMHGGVWSPAKIWSTCERFAKFGKPLHFTETTIVSGPREGDAWGKTTPEGEKRQAQEVEQFYRMLFSHPSVEAITWWDFSDQGAWQRAPAGLVRADLTPKPAYDALMNLIKKEWWTKADVKTDAAGNAKFRGYLGDYSVTVSGKDGDFTGTFSLSGARTNKGEVRLSAAKR